MKTNNLLKSGAVGLGLALTVGGAQAAVNWQLTSTAGCSSQQTNPAAYGNSCNFSGTDGTAVTATAWANTTGTANTAIQDAYLGVYSGGLGVANRDGPLATGGDAGDNPNTSPEHSTDNDQRYDSVLFSFASSVELSQVTIGWKGSTTSINDSDITVLAYTGTAAPPPLSGKTYADLTLTQGWTLVGHYANLLVGTPMTINNGTQPGGAIYSSSYWLIGAYNPLVGSSPGWTLKDGVKIKALAGTVDTPQPPTGVPEPSSLLLLGAGLAGAAGWRRKIRG